MKTLVLSRRETDAWLHVKDVQLALFSGHRLSSCPTGTGETCRYHSEWLAVVRKIGAADRVLDADGNDLRIKERRWNTLRRLAS